MRKLLLVAGALLLSAGPAVAQTTSTTYPPPTSSTSSTSTTGATTTTAPTTTTTGPGTEVVTRSLGELNEGDTRTVRSCGFDDDVAVFFNEQLVDASDEIDGEGCAEQTLRIVEDGQPGFGPRPLAAVGTGGLELAQALTPVVEIDGKRFVARAGQNVLQNIGFDADGNERFVRTLFTLGDGTGGGGALARTGATIVRWSLPGAALLGVGALLVLAARRRHAAS